MVADVLETILASYRVPFKYDPFGMVHLQSGKVMFSLSLEKSMSSLPKNVPFDSLYLEGNVRTEGCKRVSEMVESLRRNGFKTNHPLVVSFKDDGRHLVLCGNRRTEGLAWLQENDPAAFQRALPNDKLPCIVWKGLTEEEEVLLRIDHSSEEDRVALDEWSLYLAVQQLVKVGYDTQEKIAEKLGIFIKSGKNAGKPNRSWVQPRVNLARLPAFVAEELQKRNSDRKSTALRWEHVPTLFKVWSDEFEANPDSPGPKFMKLWEETLNPKAKDTSEHGEKPLSVADAKKRAMAASSSTLRNALLCVTGQGKGVDFVTLDTRMVEAETAVMTLKRIEAYLGDEKYQQLVGDANECAAMQRECNKEAVTS